MRLMRIGLLVAVCMTLCGGCEEKVAQKADGGIWGDPEISAAVEKIRAGQTVDTMRLISKAKPDSSWKPVKKNLPKYHACLGANENPRVQFFAVAAVSRLKDKSSVLPLQKFIVTAQRRLQEGTISHEEENRDPSKAAQRRQKGGLLSREDSVMLHLSIGGAMETLGEIDGDTDISVAFLGSLLKHDMPKEWGGAVAHSALAKKGAPGLRRLLKESESLTGDDSQIAYVSSAISEIRDPALIPILYAACLNKKYPLRVRASAMFTLEGLRANSVGVEDLIINILMDEESDIRNTAAVVVCRFGTTKGREVLEKVRKNPGKSGGALVQAINDDLLQYDTANSLEGVIRTILSPETPDSEKTRLCYNIKIMDKNTVAKYATTLVPCLNVRNTEGQPLNKARISIWLALYRSTKVMHPLTLLPYENDQRFKDSTSEIREIFSKEYINKGEYPQHEKLAEEAVKKMITIWGKGNTEKQAEAK